MQTFARTGLRSVPIVACLGLLASLAAAGQESSRAHEATLRRTLTGRVLLPSGAPAAGAVVVSSVGGEVRTGADGSFALDLELPSALASVELEASLDERGGADLVASTSFVPAALSSGSVGVLTLTLATSCRERWLPTFGGHPGVTSVQQVGSVNAAVVFDDGSGPALYVGGSFHSAGGFRSQNLARWDGASWHVIGADDAVHALLVHDDGSGPALYAGGAFESIGGVAASGIARWDGASWSPLGTGVEGLVQDPFVDALAVYDDGSGPVLVAAGDFDLAGGAPAAHIARWDGVSWSALGSGTDNWVRALATFDDGGGPALYAGGLFGMAGGVPVSWVAKWDGASWSSLGSTGGNVHALLAHDDGNGPRLYAGGAGYLRRWSGSSWEHVGGGLQSSGTPEANALLTFDDGSGPALFVAGLFTSAGGVPATNVARWDGSSWSALAEGVGYGLARCLVAFDAGTGAALHVGGQFEMAFEMGFGLVDRATVNGIARWDGAGWRRLGGTSVDDIVHALAIFDDGSGPALYAAGRFERADGTPVNHVVRRSGTGWQALGEGPDRSVYALAVHDDGSGPALYAGGAITMVDGSPANHVARWDGSAWSPVGGGLPTEVYSLGALDAGDGTALYAGTFSGYIWRWDGAAWSQLGAHILGHNGTAAYVNALAVFDDGSGPALYIGGTFYGGIRRWNGVTWDLPSFGLNHPGFIGGASVNSMVVHHEGSGPALYVGGDFTTAGASPALRVARWDGTTWSALGAGLGSGSPFSLHAVHCLTVFDAGAGPVLFAGGQVPGRISAWDGTAWSAIGSALDAPVNALLPWDDGSGPALFAAGGFRASSVGDSFLAKWGCRPKPTVRRR
ncbi:MAG TPA: hypothetical protein VF530_00520 [Planctomycetota bacterium]